MAKINTIKLRIVEILIIALLIIISYKIENRINSIKLRIKDISNVYKFVFGKWN